MSKYISNMTKEMERWDGLCARGCWYGFGRRMRAILILFSRRRRSRKTRGISFRIPASIIRRVVINERGKGYGKEAMNLLMAWAFEDAGAHRGWLDCKDYNDRALHVYESLGLRREGLLRETILVNGKYENLVVLGILEDEWRERNKGK